MSNRRLYGFMTMFPACQCRITAPFFFDDTKIPLGKYFETVPKDVFNLVLFYNQMPSEVQNIWVQMCTVSVSVGYSFYELGKNIYFFPICFIDSIHFISSQYNYICNE